MPASFIKKMSVTAATIAMGASLASFAPSAFAGENQCGAGAFCAWEHKNYGGTFLLSTHDTSGSNISVARDMASSGINRDDQYKFSGVSDGTPWDSTVFTWGALTRVSLLTGSANDTIDWFYAHR
ncbi:hypothetical protein KEM60_00667 [Austwickia sp. TVS 96-490-7B]|uniref:peptidase inhibitor family I36 protein n=1 Tax=Austwickia sp. TVS 96-490-7B TaxID=2830843 RepID=UPI001C5734F2|nr:peptidase inhibitor family I36 protein [Austwickia sp. TVS 96-490-7B]MBW3084479.1 hypothetical protein [Austwickia sp. TVS 96-490-7B]